MKLLRRPSKKFLFLLLLISTKSLWALTFNLAPDGGDIVGQIQSITLTPNQSLSQLARQYDVGYIPLLDANPGIDPDKRKKNVTLIIPTQFILPAGPREGIYISLAEMRLYYYPENQNIVMTFPLGVGKQGWATPRGFAKVYEKIANPTWHVPDSISEDLASQGIYLPRKVLPGPLDPLGPFALRLTIPGYLIHGTNMPSSIGKRSSSGCIRLYPEDITTLYSYVPLKTPVRIINNPYKIGMGNGQMYLEAHKPMKNDEVKEIDDLTPLLETMLTKFSNQSISLNYHLVASVAKQHLGIPQIISGDNT